MTTDVRPQPPLADTVSPEARALLAPMLAAPPPPADMAIADMRAFSEQMTGFLLLARQALHATTVEDGELGGVPAKYVRPAEGADDAKGLLINFHGGGFVIDAGSLLETLPIAALTGMTVATVLYRLAPENKYPAAVDDALAAYKAALAIHGPDKIAVFGTSAGAVLTMQLMVRLKAEGLPLPAAAGIFSGAGDLSRAGDIEGYLPPLQVGKLTHEVIREYIGDADPTDPLISPQFGDLSGLPPTMVMSSTRDLLLSHCCMLHLALREAGNVSDLVVYEGLPHAFWAWLECPETNAALGMQAKFLKGHIKP
ncbi:MAG: alpha/beta hydrolase fold protein [Caulobacter sp.]|nr:alpha/beta hydrolase fold protein [Caulobacter sp.]